MVEYALIVAGGSGNRMKSSIPKQFIILNGLPVLMHTINVFKQYSKEIKIVLVLPENQTSYWGELIEEYNFKPNIQLVHGGDSRFESVKNGLLALEDKVDSHVAIHDGVRPLVTVDTIRRSFNSAKESGSGVAAVELKDSLRELTSEGNKNVARNKYRIIQTPQTFRLSLIKAAYSSSPNKDFTDDASVAEANGIKIALVSGDYQNIKITTPEDVKIAQALLING